MGLFSRDPRKRDKKRVDNLLANIFQECDQADNTVKGLVSIEEYNKKNF